MSNYYNREVFPLYVRPHGAWDLYANDKGEVCALPVDPASGHKACAFGDVKSVAKDLGYPKPSEMIERAAKADYSGICDALFARATQDAEHAAKAKSLMGRTASQRSREHALYAVKLIAQGEFAAFDHLMSPGIIALNIACKLLGASDATRTAISVNAEFWR